MPATTAPATSLLIPPDHMLILIDYQSQMPPKPMRCSQVPCGAVPRVAPAAARAKLDTIVDWPDALADALTYAARDAGHR